MSKLLADSFYVTPNNARQMVTTKELRQIMLDTAGEIITCGRLRKLSVKHLGAGVHLLSLKEF